MAHRKLSYSHRSEVLSSEQWRPIAPSWCSNRQLFEGILWLLRSGAGWLDCRTHTLVRQRVGLDDIVGKRRDSVTGVAHVDRRGNNLYRW